VGFDKAHAEVLAHLARECYLNPESYKVYDDTLPVLEYLSDRGWRHVILSNHVPELPEIVEAIGLSTHISRCFSSALTGYEKPNPEAFRTALAHIGNPRTVWVIGDNLTADVRGAEAVGLPAILVRTARTEEVKYYATDLKQVCAILKDVTE